MKVLRLEEPRALEQAIAAIQHGGVIAFPTDTVYGLGASLTHPAALSRIYEIKERDLDRPLPVLIASPAALGAVASDVRPALLELASTFWPGPLTVALPARDGLPSEVIAGDGTVGVRVPDHSVALTIADRCGGAIVVTSANLSGQMPARHADDIAEALAEKLDVILDGGMAPLTVASTVIRLDGDTISILREGAIDADRIQVAWTSIVTGQTSRGRV